MTYALVADVATEVGRSPSSVTSVEEDQWQGWIDRVERQIEQRFRRAGLVLADQVALDDPTSGDLMDVIVEVVARKVRNPNGDTSTTVTIDDGSVTRRREGVDDSQGLDLTDGEWARLLPASGRRRPRAFSVMPS